MVEWYDFTLYLYLTPVISRVFFGGAKSSVLETLAVFAVSYIMRPVGATVFGHYGDRIGRRNVLLISMSIMTVAMLLTGLLPTRASAGLIAPALLFLLRCVMGFSVGGEYSGVLVYLVESSGARHRGLLVSLAAGASEVGALLAAGICALVTTVLTTGQLDSWGWRIPFLFGAVLAGTTLLRTRSRSDSGSAAAWSVIRCSVSPITYSGRMGVPNSVVATRATSFRCSTASPSVVMVAEVPMHCTSVAAHASRSRRTSSATSAPCLPR